MTILVLCMCALLTLNDCQRYRDLRKAEQDAREEAAARYQAETGEDVRRKLGVPKAQERIEEIPSLPSTPTPKPSLLTRPVDPAGQPQP